ncbi:MAG: pilus assembly protein PilM [Dehalococcoidales bacterium]|nr:pilus assembly protein PilM [Dehalococcoidales bacterium]
MITIEISATDIRLMETDGDRVVRWASRSLEPGIFEDEVVTDPAALSAAVKQFMASSGIRGGDVTASVSGLYSVSRLVLVPAPPGTAITQTAVLEEAREIMPLPEDELYLSWQHIAAMDGGQQVLVLGIPRDIVDSEVQALKAGGINPRILDLKAMALARAVNREQALILNIEAVSFDIIVVVNGITSIMRTTAWQSDELSPEERAEHLAVALDLTVGFHNSNNPALPLDLATPLFITGWMSGDLALVERLQSRVQYPVEPVTPPLKYPPHLPVSQYAVNIGLALKGSATTRNLGGSEYLAPDINLLPQIYRPWKPTARQLYMTGMILAAMVLLFPLYQLTAAAVGETAVIETRYDIVNNELIRRQEEIKNREPLQKVINEYRTIINMGGGFTEDLTVINTLAEQADVRVGSVSHQGSSITIASEADTYIAFRNYLAALEESGRFSSPIPPPEGYPYVKSGTIKLERKPAQ